MSISFPRNALLRTYKSFIRSHLDYADIIYDKPNNASFKKNRKRSTFVLQLLVRFKERLESVFIVNWD